MYVYGYLCVDSLRFQSIEMESNDENWKENDEYGKLTDMIRLQSTRKLVCSISLHLIGKEYFYFGLVSCQSY